nr:TolC family protein [Achromobacter pulmonis]
MTSSIGLQVSIPIFSGGGTSAALRQAVDNKERLRLESEAKALEVLNDLRRQFNLHNSSAAKLKAYRLAAASARELILAMRKSVASGERVNADVLDAEQRYFDALRNLARARYAYLQAGLKIRYLAGTLTAGDVRAVSEYFVQGGGRSGADDASAPPRF